jgi:hypothetical protein
MCCFTRTVTSVSDTRIFARASGSERQFLVYSMKLKAQENLAMVLPLPVRPGTGEHGVIFISLQNYPHLFDDLEKGFPVSQTHRLSEGFGPAPASAAMRPLDVVQVGNFEASFVPTENDFSRLDDRFRIPATAWQKLGDYKTYGFAVFKLKPGNQDVHPMAFSFPRRDVHSLFFPTVNIHDGKVHASADFDHILYCQPREGEPLKFDKAHSWRESSGHARNFILLAKAHGLFDPDPHCYKTTMNGELPNRDTFIALESGA